MYYKTCLIALLMTVSLLPVSPSAKAEGAGYSGLIAPANPEPAAPNSNANPAQNSGGYSGLIVPLRDAATGQKPEPEGYAGVIQGHVAVPPQNRTKTAVKKPEALGTTPAPGLQKFGAPKSSRDLQAMAMFHGMDKNMDGVPDALKQPTVIPADLAKAMNKPTMRVDNMLPMEFAMKKNVDTVMAIVGDKKISNEERVKQAKYGYENISQMMTGLRAKRAIPDAIYKKMGLSDGYINEQKEGIDAALIRLDKAAKTLEPYAN